MRTSLRARPVDLKTPAMTTLTASSLRSSVLRRRSVKVKKFQLFASVDDEEMYHKSSNKNYAEDQKIKLVGKLGRGSKTNKEGKNIGSSSGLYVRAEISENHYCGLFIARVRLLYIIRVVRSMEIWTPVLTQ